MISLFKNFALISVITAILYGLGVAIDHLLPWTWLVTFFALIRQLIMPFDFLWDTTTLFSIISISLSIEAIFWSVKALMSIIHASGLNQN